MVQAPLLYRTVLPVNCAGSDPVDVFKAVRAGAASWLADKGYGPEAVASSGLHRPDLTTSLEVVSTYGADGGEAGLRLQLTEDQGSVQWITTLSALSAGVDGAALVGVDLECQADRDTPPPSGPPRIIRQLVDALSPVDGLPPEGPVAHLTTAAQDITADHVDDLLHVLTHRDRHKPAIVAARPLTENAEWSWRFGRICEQAAGFASLYLLVDVDAVDTFRREIGEDHRVAPGMIRTFLPEVDPAWPADGYRHRFLSWARMADSRDHAWRNIAPAVQRHTTASPTADRLRDAVFLSGGAREDAAAERRSAVSRARDTASDQASLNDALREEVAVLTALLQAADETLVRQGNDHLRLQHQMSDVSATQRAAEDQAEQDMAEHLETLAALEQAHGEVHRLRTLLLKSGAAEEAYAEVLVPEPPSSFETLLDRLGELPKILFSGDRRRTLGLDDTDGRKAPMWARKSWQALRALDSYALISTTEGFNGNFRAFCERQPSGALVISKHNVAMVESESVNNQWLDERLLPVPIEVDPAGKVVMEAHVKIDSKGSTSPRIYFYDDTAGVTGKVIVGLISRHPTNTQS